LLRNSEVPHFTLFLHLCRSLLIILVCTITKILVAHIEGQTKAYAIAVLSVGVLFKLLSPVTILTKNFVSALFHLRPP
jgi:hypothetical protein